MKELYRRAIKVIKSGNAVKYLINGRIIKALYRELKQSSFYRIFPRFFTACFTYFKNTRGAVFFLNELEDGFKYRELKNNHIDDNAIIRIIDAYNLAKSNQSSHPESYKAGGLWELMSSHHEKLINALKSKDVSEVKRILNDFAISEISKGLSLSGGMPINFKERMEWLNSFNQGYQHWKRMTNLPGLPFGYDESIGNLFGIRHDGELILQPSFRLSYFAKRINDLLQPSKGAVIVEIGGGYGGLPFHLFNEGDICKTYLDFDIPEVLVICSYFLMSSFPERKIMLYGECDISSVNFSDYEIILMPHFEIQKLQKNSCDLVFNSHSLTEMDNSSVTEYLNQIDRVCKKYFLHANHEFSLNENYNYKSKSGIYKCHVNLNSPEYELPVERFRKVYRMPEIIQNGTYGYKEYDYFEYLYERI